MSKSQVGKIIGQVLASLWKRLHPLHLPRPTKDILMASAQQYFLQWDLPHCIGSLDVCHIEIKKPPHSGSKYYNYKKFFSTPLQALVDADGKFISIDVGGYGSQHDSTTFRCSSLYKNFKAGKLNFPEDDGRYGLEVNTPYFIIGDGAYALSRNLIKPYPGHELTSMQKMFNKRISRARINVERAFGKLKKKWKIFKQPIEQKLSKTKLIVTVACVLTNTIIDLETLGVDVNPRQPAIVHRVVGNDVFTGNSQVVRNKLMTYMINNPI
uniref:DDE Tnp4 domain-containing protein n=1 Tax=Trichogramma kaykai TaxID=54128 RepID=A0ABD2VVJ1_9HYME